MQRGLPHAPRAALPSNSVPVSSAQNLPVCSVGVIRGSGTCDADGTSAAAVQVGGLVCREVLCLRSFASDVACVAQLAAAHVPAEAGAVKSVRGALGLAEATGERVRCSVVRCGWSMWRTFCGTSGSCAKKRCQSERMHVVCIPGGEKERTRSASIWVVLSPFLHKKDCNLTREFIQ